MQSFCYVDDTVRGLVAMADSSGGITGPISIGKPGERTLALRTAKLGLELSIVNDCSTYARGLAVRVFSRKRNMGKGAALRIGLWRPLETMEACRSRGLSITY